MPKIPCLKISIAFLAGLITPVITSLLSAPFYAPIHFLMSQIDLFCVNVLFTSNPPVVLILLKYSILPFGLLFAPSVNALLLCGFQRPSGRKYLFLALLAQVLLFVAIVFSFHWFTPLCTGNNCILTGGGTIVFFKPEQVYYNISMIGMIFLNSLIGTYWGSFNPLGILTGKIRDRFRKMPEHLEESKAEANSVKKRKPWFPLLIGGISWSAVTLFFLLAGLFCVPIQMSAWNTAGKTPDVLHVYIETNPTEPGLFKDAYRLYVLNALCQWEIASKGLFRFETVPRKEQSEISIEWEPFSATNALDWTHRGFTYVSPNEKRYSVHAAIKIKSQQVPDNVMKVAILHEIGHALGLNHSPNPEDIMYMSVLSTEERKVLLLSQTPYTPQLTHHDKKALIHRYPALENKTLKPADQFWIIQRYRDMAATPHQPSALLTNHYY